MPWWSWPRVTDETETQVVRRSQHLHDLSRRVRQQRRPGPAACTSPHRPGSGPRPSQVCSAILMVVHATLGRSWPRTGERPRPGSGNPSWRARPRREPPRCTGPGPAHPCPWSILRAIISCGPAKLPPATARAWVLPEETSPQPGHEGDVEAVHPARKGLAKPTLSPFGADGTSGVDHHLGAQSGLIWPVTLPWARCPRLSSRCPDACCLEDLRGSGRVV